MKKLLFIFLLFITIESNSQNQLPLIETKPLIENHINNDTLILSKKQIFSNAIVKQQKKQRRETFLALTIMAAYTRVMLHFTKPQLP